MNGYLDDLKKYIPAKLFLVVGSGVTASAAPTATVKSWAGLLQHGIEFAASRDKLSKEETSLLKKQVSSGSAVQLNSVGEVIARSLGGSDGIDYRNWLLDAFSGVKIADSALLSAIRDSGISIVTTNYDGLLEEATGLQPITWMDRGGVRAFVSREERAIFHLHGYYKDPKSVVLGTRSYEEIIRDNFVRAQLQAMVTTNTLVFVGCGAGLEDDDFGSLREWMSDKLGTAGNRHFVLVPADQQPVLNAKLEDWIRAVSYGQEYCELPVFIAKLWPATSPANSTAQESQAQGARRGPTTSKKTPASASQIDALVGFATLAKRAEDALDKLCESIVKRKRPNSYLYASNTTDVQPSVTVTAITMLALGEVRHREAHFICDELLSARAKTGEDEGAWYGQGGSSSHSLATSWALFSCLRIQPASVRGLASTTDWILKQQTRKGGWGFHPIRTGDDPKAFYTAYVLSALIEYKACLQLTGQSSSQIDDAVQQATSFLTDVSPRAHNPDNILLWSHDPAGADVCLATTSMCLHVLAKQHRAASPLLLSPLKSTLQFLCKILKDGPPASEKSIVARVGVEKVAVDPWPRFLENGPNYWYRYFTPIIAVTLLDAAHDLGITPFPVLLEAVTNTVEWIVSRVKQQQDGLWGISLDDDQKRIALWPIAQSILILKRWLDALGSSMADPNDFASLILAAGKKSRGAAKGTK